MARNTTLRDRHRRTIAKDQPPCHLCGKPIDYRAHHLDPQSFTMRCLKFHGQWPQTRIWVY